MTFKVALRLQVDWSVVTNKSDRAIAKMRKCDDQTYKWKALLLILLLQAELWTLTDHNVLYFYVNKMSESDSAGEQGAYNTKTPPHSW